MSVLFLHILYLIAITAEAMTAALAAGRRRMDWVGVCLLGCVTALGGGSARDVLLGHYPLVWVEHPSYLLVTAGAALATIAIARLMRRLRTLSSCSMRSVWSCSRSSAATSRWQTACRSSW